MKKIYLSLIAIAILLFTACNNNDVPGNEGAVEVGTLTATISFEGKTLRTASSTAIPTVSWANVKQVQVFLYNKTTGSVAFSRTVKPTADGQKFTWDNVPVGEYRLALLANVKNSTDNMATSVDGTVTEFTDENVIGKAFNSSLKIDLKPADLPTKASPQDPPTHDWDVPTTGRIGYAAPSEVFTAYKDLTIAAGTVTSIPATDLVLRREIAMLRARFNTKVIPTQPVAGPPTFGNASDFIAIQRVPVGLGLFVGDFKGGILNTASDTKRVMVGATGMDTYKTAKPASGYGTGEIITGDFTMFNDIHVLPNVSLDEITEYTVKKDDNVPEDIKTRKYFIIFSAQVKKDYVYADGTIAPDDNSMVYWFGTIDGVFTKNVIREVNLTLKTAGYPEIPGGPDKFGGLEIVVGAPENWDSEIVDSNMEV